MTRHGDRPAVVCATTAQLPGSAPDLPQVLQPQPAASVLRVEALFHGSVSGVSMLPLQSDPHASAFAGSLCLCAT